MVDTTALRLDGYYWYHRPSPSGGTHGTSPLILWSDGTAALSDLVFDSDIQAEHEDVIGMLKNKTGERYSPIGLRWGGFRVCGDSISIQVMELSSKPRSWDPIAYNGHIRNDTTFVIAERIEPRTTFALGRKRVRLDPPWVFHFQPLAPGEKPTSDNWTQTHDALQ